MAAIAEKRVEEGGHLSKQTPFSRSKRVKVACGTM
ncbi:hypothetical protein SAMN05444680_12371 [Variovorax sp. YR216]|nr:hypothetical protein SAMN05444680_12371 [Variovorax sp. YR216]